MKYLNQLILTTLIIIVGSLASAGMSPSIDVVRVFKSDVFGTDKPAVVTLRITGENQASPFMWSITVERSSDILFAAEHDDKWLDKFFSDGGYIDECEGYAECKQKWYFDDISFLLQDALKKINRTDRPLKKWEADTLHILADEFLEKKGLDQTKRSAVLTEMVNLLSSSYISFCPPYTPVQQDTCYMYVPSLGYFVPYWDD